MPSRRERERQAQEQERASRQRGIAIGVGAGLVALAVIVLVVRACGVFDRPAPTATPLVQAAQAGTCGSVQTFPSQGGEHILPNQEHAPYNSNPPTSGPHWANPQDWGIYTMPQLQEQLVHNLEHGGIIIQYRDLTTAEVQRVAALVNADNHHVILAPDPALSADAKVALTAWTHLETCTGVNESAIQEFINTYRDHGPEVVP